MVLRRALRHLAHQQKWRGIDDVIKTDGKTGVEVVHIRNGFGIFLAGYDFPGRSIQRDYGREF